MSKENRHGEPTGEKRAKNDEEDSEVTVMFKNPCTLQWAKPPSNSNWILLGTEKIKILYDDEMLTCRVHFSDENDQCLFGNLIDDEIKLKVNLI